MWYFTVDTIVVLGGILGSVLWMNGKFQEIDQRFSNIEKDIAIVKTVFIMKDVMSKELANKEGE